MYISSAKSAWVWRVAGRVADRAEINAAWYVPVGSKFRKCRTRMLEVYQNRGVFVYRAWGALARMETCSQDYLQRRH